MMTACYQKKSRRLDDHRTVFSFPLIRQKEKERKQLLLQLQSMEGSQKEATQTPPIHVHMPFQPRQSLYKDLSIQHVIII